MARKYLIMMPDTIRERPDEKEHIKNILEDGFSSNFPIENIIRADILKKKFY